MYSPLLLQLIDQEEVDMYILCSVCPCVMYVCVYVLYMYVCYACMYAMMSLSIIHICADPRYAFQYPKFHALRKVSFARINLPHRGLSGGFFFPSHTAPYCKPRS